MANIRGAQPVVDVVGVVGDIVGDRAGLGFGARIEGELEVLPGIVFRDLLRNAAPGVAAGRTAAGVGQRAVVLHQAFERLEGEVEAVEGRVAALQARHHRERLGVVVEAAVEPDAVMHSQAMVERALAGMPERRMTEIVGKRAGLRQVLIEAERARERARDLGDLERVREPCAIVVAFVEHEDLGLVGEPAERRAVDDAVAIAAEIVACGATRLVVETPAGGGCICRIGRARKACTHRHPDVSSRSFVRFLAGR